jgi:HSP20 family protein
MMLPQIRREGPLAELRSAIDDFLSEPFFRMGDREITGQMWLRIDAIEEKDHFAIKADLPGVDKNDLNISIEGDVLTISGEKKEELRKEEHGYSHYERSYGSFSRSFTLPENVDKEHVQAHFDNGVLELHLKKTGELKQQARQIEIEG